MNQRRLLLAIFISTLALLFPIAAHACAVCLTGAGTNDPVADAFNSSVLFLMAMPYAVVGSIAGWLFYNYRRELKKRLGPGKKALVLHLVLTHKESGR